MNLTLFDLDNTLLPIDSDYAWGEFTNRIGWTDPVVFKAKNKGPSSFAFRNSMFTSSTGASLSILPFSTAVDIR